MAYLPLPKGHSLASPANRQQCTKKLLHEPWKAACRQLHGQPHGLVEQGRKGAFNLGHLPLPAAQPN